MYLFNNTQWNQKHRKAMPGGKHIQLLLPSIIGIVLSFSFFIGASWAWYTDTALGVLENVSMADFSCDVSVTSADTDFSDTRRSASGEPAEFSLVANGTYEVKILTSGTATTGYCILKFWDAVNERQIVYYTDQITADSAFIFTYQNGMTEQITAAGNLQADILSVESYWGDRQIAALETKQADIQYVHVGDVIGNAPIHTPSEAEYNLQNLNIVVSGAGDPMPESVPVSDQEGSVSESESESGSDEPMPEPTSEESVPETESESMLEENSQQISETNTSPESVGVASTDVSQE